MRKNEQNHNENIDLRHEFQELHIEASEYAEIVEEPIQDGKHLVKKKRRERLVRKGRMKQERFRGFMRFFLSLAFLLWAMP